MNEKKNIGNALQNRPSKPPFRVPDGYFDTLEDRIEARIADESSPVSSKGKLIRMMKPMLAMAASFALIFMLVYYPLSVFLPNYLAKNTEIPADTTTVNENDLVISYLTGLTHSYYDLFSAEEETPEIEVNEQDMLDYLAFEMNEAEIYAELAN